MHFGLKTGIDFEHFGLELPWVCFTCLSDIGYTFLPFWLEKGDFLRVRSEIVFMGNRIFWSENWYGLKEAGTWHTPTTNFEEYPLTRGQMGIYPELHVHKMLGELFENSPK